MLRLSLALGAVAVAAASLSAQMTTFVPDGFQSAEGNSTWPYPFNFVNTTGMRQQLIYDSSNFTGQGVTGPILINRLRWRANGAATCSGRTFNNVAIHLSTSPVDYQLVTGTFANNQGANLTTVYSGPVTVNAISAGSTPGPMHVDVVLTTPFLYDPAAGDLTIDVDHDGTAAGGTSAALDLCTIPTLGSLIFSTTSRTVATAAATSVRIGHAMMIEVGWVPPGGLAASFTANVRTGSSPLQVSFTDRSYSNSPVGVVAWNWDFNGDNLTDSTLQNPTFTYTQCGSYTVTMTAIDGLNPPNTHVRNNYIVTDTVAVSFSRTLLSAPNVWQFTDTSTPVPQGWAWDFDGDNVTDSTLQNPTWAFAQSCGGQTVRLDARIGCQTTRGTQRFVAAPLSLATSLSGGGGINSSATVGNMFDLSVTAPDGIVVCGLTMTPYTFWGPYTLTVFVTAGSYVGRDASATMWRQVATGSGQGTAGGFNPPLTSEVALANSFYLPAGNYGIAVYISGVPTNSLAYSGTNIGPFANADLVVHPNPTGAPGIAKSGLFTATIFAGRWNGVIHYTRNSVSRDPGYGFFGEGCPGSSGVPGNVATSQPRINSTLGINVTNLPQSAVLFFLGFSNTTAPVGPLPFDLGGFGAPGCMARVRPDAVLFVSGAANVASISVTIPNMPGLLGLLFYSQGLSLDPAANAAGFTATDAAGGVVGQ